MTREGSVPEEAPRQHYGLTLAAMGFSAVAFAFAIPLVIPALPEIQREYGASTSTTTFLITGMINTKDPVGYFEAFAGMARHVFTVPVPDSDASLDPDFLADTADEAGLTAEPAESVEAAIAAICSNWDGLERPPRILIGGSLYLLGDVLRVNGTPPV